jgi:DNA repair protein RecO (recombination protein O)
MDEPGWFFDELVYITTKTEKVLIKTRGIVFRSIKYSESSVIVDIFTEERGMRSYLVPGVRRKNARISPGLLQVMSLVDMVAYEKHEKGLNRIREIKSAVVYQSLPFEVHKSAVGLFMAEVARKSIREPEENPRLFEFLFRTFQFLDQTALPISNLHLHFLLELSFHLGFVPGGAWSEETPYFDLQEGLFASSKAASHQYLDTVTSQVLYQLLRCDYAQCHEVRIGRQMRQDLLDKLLAFYRYHIDNFPEINAHSILKTVLS